jgi:hypothetical protein
MTLIELKGKYARLRAEIDSLGGAGEHSEAKLARMKFELDEIDQELAAVRRRAQIAPTLRDVVSGVDAVRSISGSNEPRLMFG